MIGPANRWDQLVQSIHYDEVGIAIGVVGRFRLRTVFQPVYHRQDNALRPALLRASTIVQRDGLPASLVALSELESIPRRLLQRLSALLALHNHGHADLNSLDLYLESATELLGHPDALADALRGPSMEMEEAGIAPGQIVCELLPGTIDLSAARSASVALRRHGVRVAIAHSRADEPVAALLQAISPEIVRIDHHWLVRLYGHPSSRSLLRPLVNSIQLAGARVLMEGLDTTESLSAALQSEANYLQGDRLHAASLAGSLINPAILSAQDFVAPTNVIPLRTTASKLQRDQ